MAKDTIANILIVIRNAEMNTKRVVRIAFMNLSESLVIILLRDGFIKSVRKHNENNKSFLVLTLRCRRNQNEPYKNRKVLNLKRISRPGLQIYSNYQKIPRILGGMKIVILSTSRGLMIDRDARSEKIGGECLCYIW